MHDDKSDLDFRSLRISQMLDQARSGVGEVGRLLKIHQEEMVRAGFTEQQAWQMTLQLHQAYSHKIMSA